jgi:hypothetical protein
MKNLTFAKFFNPSKSMSKNGSRIHRSEKRHGILVWNSLEKGTYVRAKHGILK